MFSVNGQLGGPRRSRTTVWQHFVYSDREDKTSCAVDLCTSVLSGKNTAHLRRHLELKHPLIYAMLPRDGRVKTSMKKTPDIPSPQLPGNMTEALRKNFKKRLNSIMDSLLKSTVSEITNAFDTVTFDHQMVMKQKIEEISMLRLKLEKAEKKLREQNGMCDQKEDVTHASGQMMPEITVDVPDDWCAPLGCENVVDQTPSTSYTTREGRSNSLCSLSVSLWRLPDIKQEVQDDGYQLDGSLSGPYQDEGPQHNLKHTKQKKPLSAPKHRRPRSVRPTQNLKGSTKLKLGQPIYAPMRSNERLPRTEKLKMEVTHTEKGRGKKKNIAAIKLEPEQMEETSEDKTYPCKFCSKGFDTEFGRSVHTRSHKKCTGCYKVFRFPSYLRTHIKSCTKLRKANSSDIDKSLSHRKIEKHSLGEDKAILPIRTQHSTRKRKCQKRGSVFPAKNTAYFPKRDKAFPCKNCHKRFCSVVWLQNHISRHLACRLEPLEAIHSELAAISSKEKHSELGAVSSKEKQSEFSAVSSKEKHSELRAVSSKEKQSELGAVSSKEKQSELGAVSSKEKQSFVDDSKNMFG